LLVFILLSAIFSEKKVQDITQEPMAISLINLQAIAMQTPQQKKSIEKHNNIVEVKEPKKIEEIPKKNSNMPKEKIEIKDEIVKKEELKTVEDISKKQELQIDNEIVKEDKQVEKDIEKINDENLNEENTQENLEEQAKASQEEIYVNLHLAEIRQLLQENLYYPRSAKVRRLEGEVVVRFCLNTSGEISGIKVVSSEIKILKDAAVETIKRVKFPKPEKELVLNIPIIYKLKN
jgi:protein TonB